MLDTLLSSSVGESLTFTSTLAIIFATIFLGVIISVLYIKTNKNMDVQGFAITLIMLPAIIAIIILLVGNNVARAFSLAGAFSIIRFRSSPGGPKDLSYIFFTLAVGLSAGMGYIGYAFLFTIILCVVMLVLDKIDYGKLKTNSLDLKITVPENLNYEETFDDVLRKHTTFWQLVKVKTKEFGALFELNYKIAMNDGNQKEFIDELRARNGNLSISLTSSAIMDKSYV